MRWHLKSPASWLFAQPFVHAQIKENIKAPRHWPLWGEFTGDRWIPRTKGKLRRKCFQFITSSCAHSKANPERLGTSHPRSQGRETSRDLIARGIYHRDISIWITANSYARDPYRKFHNVLDKYHTMHHFVAEMCTHVHIYVPKWCIVGFVHQVYGLPSMHDIGCEQNLYRNSGTTQIAKFMGLTWGPPGSCRP